MLGMHKILLPNTVKASLKHFYPWLPPGMVPMSTTNEQATKWDAWRLETATEYEVSVRKYDSDVVSMKLITGWLKCCEEEHTTWCVEKMTRKIAAVPGFRVVDVVSGNIVEQPEGCRYLALSYVWGEAHRQKDYLRLLKANYSQLTEAGGLVKQLSHLPNTIRDAILLCQRLDERHLWIDSLCIIQDSEEDKLGQIMQMDAIYLHAVLTIVAAAGSDANAGLPGIGPCLSRKVAPATSIGGLDLVAIPEDGEFELRNSKWNSRAWTFQERILSKRMLRFTSESVTFECQSACWREDFIVAGPDADRFRLADQERKEQEVRQNFHDIISADVLQFEKMMPRLEWSNDFKNIWTVIYGPLVENYTKRQLTMESDILNAFKGIEGALKRSLGDFYWGLPLYLLGQSLGWIANTGDLKRRAEFPTFSWAGWVFVEGNWGAYPDYLTGPFPGFVVFNDDGNIVYWNGDCQDDIYVGIYEWHDQLLYPSSTEMANEWDGILAQTVGNVMNAEIEIPLSSLVFFWTSVAAIEPFIYEMPEEEEEDGDEWSENREFEEGRRRRTTILEGTTVIRHFEKGILVDGDLEPEEMRSVSIQLESCEVELVYIGHSSISSGKWCLILVSWKDGIARRILPQVLFHVDASDWEAKHIRRRLVVLG
ncbi:heterokaryon incompatibility protein-domain-containing protein [Bisporella sp. PMI_857]|nr:heterokaryon incompatibility protein-domain-containing protein [Bisporella sp. PMI_857]